MVFRSRLSSSSGRKNKKEYKIAELARMMARMKSKAQNQQRACKARREKRLAVSCCRRLFCRVLWKMDPDCWTVKLSADSFSRSESCRPLVSRAPLSLCGCPGGFQGCSTARHIPVLRFSGSPSTVRTCEVLHSSLSHAVNIVGVVEYFLTDVSGCARGLFMVFCKPKVNTFLDW